MGHLLEKYTKDYFLGGIDTATGRSYGVLGHEEFKENRRHERHKEEFEFTASFAGDIQDKEILDIGFGRGDHIPLFLERGIKSYYGIDFSPVSLAIAREHFSDPRMRLELCEAKDLDESRSFDVIVMFDVIEHVPVFEMEVVWRKLEKVLRPGGFIVISTPIFDNPNQADHSDQIHPVMGIHCHKQTVGTLLRTCLRHGFLLGKNKDRYFAFVRHRDLERFPESQRTEWAKNHRQVLSNYGIDEPKGDTLSDEQGQRLVPGAGRLLIGCVTENSPKYLSQALRLVQSIRWFGGSLSGTNIMVCIVDQAEPEYAEELRRWGAFVRIVPRFSPFHPHSNKLRFLEIPEVNTYDTVMLMDCDTLVVHDFSNDVNGKTLQAKIADMATVSFEIFRELFSFYGLPLPLPEYKCTFTGQPTIWYCNAGVLIFPQKVLRSLYPSWRKFTADLAQNIHLLGKSGHFCEQASLSLAFAENPVPFEELPSAMNFPLHLEGPNAPEEMKNCDPRIIHYHHLVDPSGLIMNPPHYPQAHVKIAQFNERLKQHRRKRFDNKVFWDLRYAEYPDLGSGIGSRGSSLIYKKQILKQMIDDLSPQSVLDIGCGDQFVTSDLPDDIYTGIDVSPVVTEQNRRRYPKRRYITGDFLSESLPQFDLTICFDVVIHLDNIESYRAFVNRFISCSSGHGIISGYEGPPGYSDITFYHEPLSTTLKNGGARNLKRLGQYRDTVIWYFNKRDNMQETDRNTVKSGNEPWSASGGTFRPYFVVGCMRSGTTLLAQLLGRHPEISYVPYELREIWSKVGGVPMASPKTRDSICPHLKAQHALPEQSLRLSQAFYDAYRKNLTHKDSHAIFLSKNPHLCNKLFFVNELFNESKFIWIYRGLPDVVASLKKLFSYGYEKLNTWHYWPEGKNSEVRCWHCFFGDHLPEDIDSSRCFPGGDIKFLAEYWLENNLAVSSFFKSVSPARTLIVREEELIRDTQTAISKCLSFMAASFGPSVLEGFPIDGQRNGKWTNILTETEKETLLNFITGHSQVIDQTFPEEGLSQSYQEQIALSYAGRSRPIMESGEPDQVRETGFTKRIRTEKQKAICILGMHRSGTSALAGCLHLLGIPLGGPLLPPGPDNERGFWELKEVTEIHEALLSEFGASHLNLDSLPEDWLYNPRTSEARIRLLSVLRRNFRGLPLWGVKDPRLCVLLPLWLSLFEVLGVEPHFLITLRPPEEVAASLQIRNGILRSRALSLWFRHYKDAEFWTRGFPRHFISFDQLLAEPLVELERSAVVLGVSWPRHIETAREEILAFLEPHLRHWRQSDPKWVDEVDGALQGLYAAFLKSPGDSDSAQIDVAEHATLHALERASAPGRRTLIFVSHDASRTGAPMVLLNLIGWLKQNAGINPRIILRAGGPLEPAFRRLGDTFVATQDALNLDLLDGASLVYSNTGTNGPFLRGLPQRRMPVLTHMHELAFSLQAYGVDGFAEVKRGTDHFIACAEVVRDYLHGVHGVCDSDISVFHEAIDIPAVDAAATTSPDPSVREPLGLAPDAFLVVACGTADWRKGADLFVGLGASLRRRLPTKAVVLAWVGSIPDPRFRAQLSFDIEKLGLGDCVRFVGEKRNPYPWLARADVVVLPSREDPFPLVVLEAAALSRPVVCFDGAGGAPEFCRQAGGFIVPYCDTEAMAEVIVRLARDDACRAAVGGAGSRLARTAFDLPILGRRVQNLIDRLALREPFRIDPCRSHLIENNRNHYPIPAKKGLDSGKSLDGQNWTEEMAIKPQGFQSYARVFPHLSDELLNPNELDTLRFNHVAHPQVSIIIPAWNHWPYTYRCLESIYKNTDEVAYEVIVVDDGSFDETSEMLKRVENIEVIHHQSNLGYVRACNDGVRNAKGDHLLFLNNDTTVTKGWLKAMVELIDSNPAIGAVGAKLVYPDGKLQEAGGMIFSDGRGWNFGNGDDPQKEIYNRQCEVDYCSGACLLVRKSLFNALGGFDERYSPAYYEEADLCFALRKIGSKVIYNPKVVVIHYESVTTGKDASSDLRKYIEINRRKFIEKWENELNHQDEHPSITGKYPVMGSRERLAKTVSFENKANHLKNAYKILDALSEEREALKKAYRASEADRAARLEVIERQGREFSEKAAVLEADRAARLEVIERQGREFSEKGALLEADRAARLEVIERQGKEFSEKIVEITSSRSWRITAPLRWILDQWNRIGRRASNKMTAEVADNKAGD